MYLSNQFRDVRQLSTSIKLLLNTYKNQRLFILVPRDVNFRPGFYFWTIKNSCYLDVINDDLQVLIVLSEDSLQISINFADAELRNTDIRIDVGTKNVHQFNSIQHKLDFHSTIDCIPVLYIFFLFQLWQALRLVPDPKIAPPQ